MFSSKLVLGDFALLPPENSRRIGKIYPWRTRLLYDPELLYCAKRVNRFYDEDTDKLLRIHMVICKRFCKSSTYVQPCLRQKLDRMFAKYLCAYILNVKNWIKMAIINYQELYRCVEPRSQVTSAYVLIFKEKTWNFLHKFDWIQIWKRS